MEKPTIFFSHSAKDAEALKKLKARFVDLTAHNVEVFLSSDGQSIRLGKNWSARVEEALKQAKIMFVFLTPNSVTSSWVFFESGYAYAKDIQVIPIGLFGIDVATIPPPLSMLQGFNVTSHENLNNFIQEVNEKFGWKHALGLEVQDFSALQNAGPRETIRLLGEHASDIAVIGLRSPPSERLTLELLDAAYQSIAGEKLLAGASCSIPGATMDIRRDQQYPQKKVIYSIHSEIEPYVISSAMPIVENVFRQVLGDPPAGDPLPYSMNIIYKEHVTARKEAHRQMAKLHGTGVTVLPGGSTSHARFTFEDHFLFEITKRAQQRHEFVSVDVECRGDSFCDPDLGRLLNLLFECEVLSYGSD